MPARKDFLPGEFCWIDLATTDMEAAIAWYSELFGLTCMKMDTPDGGRPYAFLMKGGAGVGGIGQLSEEMQSQGVPPVWNSYIATADCEATEARARELGATVTVPTMTIPGHGKLAFLLDPEGASIAFWQSLSDGGEGFLVDEPGSLGWNELMIRDMDRACDFYTSLVGWTYEDVPMGETRYRKLQVGGKDSGGIMSMDAPQFEGLPSIWLVYFSVEDTQATAAKVVATGGVVHVPPTEIPVGSFACFGDPQGATFAVISVNAELEY